MALKDAVRRALASRYGGPLRAGFSALVDLQLLLARPLDAHLSPGPTTVERADVAAAVTMVVKTFERPSVARRLLRSARRHFDGRIIVADDSRVPLVVEDRLVEVVELPFNSGIPVGRNAAVALVESEFCLLADDDIVFTRALNLHHALAYLRGNPEVDIAGLVLVNLPFRRVFDGGPDVLLPGADAPLREHGELVGGAPVRYKVPNVFLARTAALRSVPWDENLRLLEHRDFFSRASGRLVTVLFPGSACYHARTPFDPHYMSYRLDHARDAAYLARKWAG